MNRLHRSTEMRNANISGREGLRKLLAGVLLMSLISGILLSSGCANTKKSGDLGDYSSYLGDSSYDSPMSAMVYEDMDGEGFGIQYRTVTDYDKMIAYSPLPVCLYFYSGLFSDNSGVTAAIEQLAEEYHEKILFVSIDGMQEKDLTGNFSINALPDFVILKNASWVASFSSSTRGTWSNSDLSDWILANSGIS